MVANPVWSLGIVNRPVATEYFNTITRHYFLTTDELEKQAMEGSWGAGWVKTGYSFATGSNTYDAKCADSPASPKCVKPVYRFHDPRSNSHFLTANEAEATYLMQPGSGWTFERIAFLAAAPDASGQCDADLWPVYRAYNNRWMFNDGNHRYPLDAEARARVAARGWTDEGIAFCAFAPPGYPAFLRNFPIEGGVEYWINDAIVCEGGNYQSTCMAISNLPKPGLLIQDSASSMPDLAQRTGISTGFANVLGSTGPQQGSGNVFVQFSRNVLGLHVDTRNRGESIYSSVNPTWQFLTAPFPGSFDGRYFPFKIDDGSEFSLSFALKVKTLNVTESSHGYGGPLFDFTDATSGHRLYVTLQTYGTVAPGDFVFRDPGSGDVIVSTVFRSDPAFGRSTIGSFVGLPKRFASPSEDGTGGFFNFRLSRGDFLRILALARAAEPAFSPSPGDYFLRNFQLTNAVVGDGEIGLNVEGMVLRVALPGRVDD